MLRSRQNQNVKYELITFILCNIVDHPQRACRGVEDRLEEVEREEEAGEVWPRNKDYNLERGRAAIARYIEHSWNLSPDWSYKLQ